MKPSTFLDILRWEWHCKYSGHKNMWKITMNKKVYVGCATCSEDNNDQLIRKLHAITEQSKVQQP